ncbi:MAG: hypothetical protein D6722_19095 [Bacteroidetes bacterium]|nr:MAG: hypothetical protein D6722_19095 [Bacteroidota bacterium]
MIKRIFTFGFFLLAGYGLHAQINPHAIGLRLGGDGDIGEAEISYQRALGASNRLELDVGFGGNRRENRLYVVGIYQWHWNITSGLNWYVGPGGVIGLYSYDRSDGYISVGLGGQIGMEFDFKSLGAPILLSIDARPMWDFIGDHSGLGWGAALGIRYTW